jgi:predicted RNA-binding protein with PUA-like domain
VDLVPMKALKQPVCLAMIKADKALRTMPLVKHTRLSVMPLAREQFGRVLEMGGQDLKQR